jgi:hypothetical protein
MMRHGFTFAGRFVVGLGLIVACYAMSLQAEQRNDWKKALKEGLEAAYPTTSSSRGILRGNDAAVRRGIVLVIQQSGMLGGGGDYGVIRKSSVRDGQLTKAFQQADDGQYLFKVGDRVYVEGIYVDDDSVSLRVRNTDPVERVVRGTTISDRFLVQVEFQFEKAAMPTATVESLKPAIDAFLKPEAEASAPKTIGLGLTPAEVENILGKPTTIIDLGAKKTYVYPNMKVIFTDGKVSDVQ